MNDVSGTSLNARWLTIVGTAILLVISAVGTFCALPFLWLILPQWAFALYMAGLFAFATIVTSKRIRNRKQPPPSSIASWEPPIDQTRPRNLQSQIAYNRPGWARLFRWLFRFALTLILGGSILASVFHGAITEGGIVAGLTGLLLIWIGLWSGIIGVHTLALLSTRSVRELRERCA